MLDPVGRRETVDTIRTLNEKFGITVILITHHMDEAAQAQRLIVMADGHIIDDGAPTEVFQHVDTRAMPAWPCRRRWAFCTNCARRG